MDYKTFAFISYSHSDMTIAKWLQKNLERFKLPVEIHNEIDAKSRYLRPIFRDQSDLSTGILGDELRRHLEESKFLILICSEASARSKWVSDEARAFVEMGRLESIIPVIVPKESMDETELFPAFLRTYFAENPDKELLGINIKECGREKALIRVVSRMLGVSFDSLWKRHLRQKRMRRLTVGVTAALLAAALYLFAVPVTVRLKISPESSHLPTETAVTCTVDGAEYQWETNSQTFQDITIPGYKRFSKVELSVSSPYFVTCDTSVQTGFGIKKDIDIVLRRDNTFAYYAGTVYDSEMNPLEGVRFVINSDTAVSNPEGYFRITLPLEVQREYNTVSLYKDGYGSLVISDESPGKKLQYILYEERR